MDNPSIRVGLAGFGLSGRIFHAPFLSADPRFSLRMICTRTGGAEEYPQAENVHSFDQLLGDGIDLVVISTPTPCHAPMAARAIAAGKHVVVEKPAAASSGEVRELCRMAEEKGVIFTVFQNRRLDGDFLTVSKLIRQGRLGEVVDYECHYDRFVQGAYPKAWKQAGGPGVDHLYNIGIHLVDQALALFGMPEAVYADLRRQRPESPGVDKLTVVLHYPELRAVLSAGETVAMPGPHFMVHGRKAAFLKYGMDPQEERLLQGLRPAGDPLWGQDEPERWGRLYTPEGGAVREEVIPTETGHYGEFYRRLYEAIVHGAPPPVTPEEAVGDLQILEAAQQSSREQRVIPMDRP